MAVCPRRKAVLNRLIAEIRIEGPDAIYPTFKLPWSILGIKRFGRCSEWWRRRELNPRPKQSAPGPLRAYRGFCSRRGAPPSGIPGDQPRCTSPTGAAAPPIGRAGLFVTPPSRLAGGAGGGARALRPGDSSYATLRSESECRSLVGICVPCAVTPTPSARYPGTQAAPSRPDAPNEKVGLQTGLYPGRPQRLSARSISRLASASARAWRLSHCRLPRASPTSTFARLRAKYIRSGISV